MLTIFQLQKSLAKFDVWETVIESVRETSDAIAVLNRGQLFLGKRPDGSEMAPYSPWYADQKSRLSGIAAITDRRTLYVTGVFWNSIKVDVDSATFNVKSDDPKASKIFTREGDILGLNKENKDEEYIPFYFWPVFKQKIEDRTQLKIV